MDQTPARVAVLTGAGGAIGRATAMSLAARGLRIVATDLDVWDAAAWIGESRYRHLPVVDDRGSLQGVVSVRDLLKALVDTV